VGTNLGKVKIVRATLGEVMASGRGVGIWEAVGACLRLGAMAGDQPEVFFAPSVVEWESVSFSPEDSRDIRTTVPYITVFRRGKVYLREPFRDNDERKRLFAIRY
jgi:hypothetical protein